MSAPQRGSRGRPVGLPKTGGRRKGTPNRATSILQDKLTDLGCDPAEELVRIAQHPKTPTESKIHIYSTLLPYVYPKRKLLEDSQEERATVNVQAMSPEEALDLARDLISVLGPRAAAPPASSPPLVEDESQQSVGQTDDQ